MNADLHIAIAQAEIAMREHQRTARGVEFAEKNLKAAKAFHQETTAAARAARRAACRASARVKAIRQKEAK